MHLHALFSELATKIFFSVYTVFRLPSAVWHLFIIIIIEFLVFCFSTLFYKGACWHSAEKEVFTLVQRIGNF